MELKKTQLCVTATTSVWSLPYGCFSVIPKYPGQPPDMEVTGELCACDPGGSGRASDPFFAIFVGEKMVVINRSEARSLGFKRDASTYLNEAEIMEPRKEVLFDADGNIVGDDE